MEKKPRVAKLVGFVKNFRLKFRRKPNMFATAKKPSVFISYKRDVYPDDSLASELYSQLSIRYDVFIDKTLLIGENWGKRIEDQIRKSDFFIVLISEASVNSDMVDEEITIAHRLFKEQNKPFVLPIRVNYLKSLEYPLGAYLNQFNWFLWKNDGSTAALVENLIARIDKETIHTHEKHTNQELASKIMQFQGKMQKIIDNIDDLVNAETTKMWESFSSIACPEILEHILRQPLYSWRRGEIKKLNEIPSVAKNNLNNWMKSEEAKQIIVQSVEAWTSSIDSRITDLISPVYKEYQIRAVLPTIFPKSSLESNVIDQEKIRSVSEDDGVAAVIDNMKMITSYMTGFLIAMVGVALLPTGPVGEMAGILTGLMFSAIFFVIGIVIGAKATDVLEKAISGLNLPLFIRRRVTDKKVDEWVASVLPEFKSKLQKGLDEELQKGSFSIQIINGIKERIFGRINEIVADWLDQ